MNKVLITSDSTCDLSKDLLTKYNVKIIPLHVNFKDKSYKDQEEITIDELYKKVEENDNCLPKTAAVAPAEFEIFFKQYIDEGYDIFFTGISSKMSTTYQNALSAAEKFPKGRICISDSGNLSTGIGLLILKACQYRDQGLTIQQIKEKVDLLVPHVKVQFVIRTLDYLYRGGRCSSMTKIFGTMLRIRPRIIVRDGEMTVGHKTIGLMKNAVLSMTNVLLRDIDQVDKNFLFVTDSLGAEASFQEIDELFKENHVYDKFSNVFHTHAGCVVGSHCGPGTIGILYIMKGAVTDDDLNV